MGIKGQIERLWGEERGRIGLRCFPVVLEAEFGELWL